MASRVVDIDRGWAKMMSTFMNLDSKNAVAIGPDPDYIMKAEPEGRDAGKNRRNAKGQFTGATRAYYPFFLEYGTRTMAARPFMRWTFDAHNNYRRELRQLANELTTTTITTKAIDSRQCLPRNLKNNTIQAQIVSITH